MFITCGCSVLKGRLSERLAEVRGERPDRSARGCGDGSSKLAGALLGDGGECPCVVSFAGMCRIVPTGSGCKFDEKRVSYVREAGHDEEEFSWST